MGRSSILILRSKVQAVHAWKTSFHNIDLIYACRAEQSYSNFEALHISTEGRLATTFSKILVFLQYSVSNIISEPS